MAANPKDWRILACRPAAQNKVWRELLQHEGFQTLDIPLLDIEPVSHPEQLQRIKQIILDFDQYDAVIFVSQNAVYHTWCWLDQYWPQFPAAMRYFAVGQKTAQQIQELLLQGGGSHVVAAQVAMNSEELLALPELQCVADRKILICRGVGGRTTIFEQLQARGASTSYCELYERCLPADAARQMAAESFEAQRDIIAVFSGETLQNLVLVAQQAKRSLRHLALLVPGERVARQASGLGFQNIIIARNASDNEMLQTLTQFIQTSG